MRFGSVTNHSDEDGPRGTSIYKYFAEPKPACSAFVRELPAGAIAMISVSQPVAPEDSVFAAFVGLDWADKKHDLVLYDTSGGPTKPRNLPLTPTVTADWARDTQLRVG